MKKHLKKISYAVNILILATVVSGCNKQPQQRKFIAKVNNAYLTKTMLAAMLDTNTASKFYRNEVIRNWINRELLYQEAVKEGILKEEEYKRLLNDSEKELASSLLVQKYYKDEKNNYEQKDVEEYYNQHKNEFKRFYDSYLINMIDFNDEDKAVQFRNTVMESDWEKALNVFKGDSSVQKVTTNSLLYGYEIHPVSLSRIISSLRPGEISIVIPGEEGHYFVMKEIQEFDKGSVPSFNVIKPLVEKRFLADRKNDLIRNYIKELYSNNDIEVRN